MNYLSLRPILLVLLLVALTIRLSYERWNLHDMQKMNPAHHGMPEVLANIAALQRQRDTALVAFRVWLHNSPTLSSAKNWL